LARVTHMTAKSGPADIKYLSLTYILRLPEYISPED